MYCDIILEYLTKLEELSNSTALISFVAQKLMTRRMSEYNMKLIKKLVDENY